MVQMGIQIGNKNGITFERIGGKRSVARAVGDNPDDIGEYATAFATLCKKLHSTPCDSSVFPSVIEEYKKMVMDTAILDPAEKKDMLAFLETVPDTGHCLHGDLHEGNVIIANGEYLFIDMADFGYGNSDLDLGSLYFTSNLTPDFIAQKEFHMSSATMRLFWKYFARSYFDTEDASELEGIENRLKPFAALRVLYIIRVGGAENLPIDKLHEQYRELIG